jgi:hypothetical protein
MKIKKYSGFYKQARKLYCLGNSHRAIGQFLSIPSYAVWHLIKDIKSEQREKLPKLGVPKQIKSSAKGMTPAKARVIGALMGDGYVKEYIRKNKTIQVTKDRTYFRCYRSRRTKVNYYSTEPSLIKQFSKDIFKVYGLKAKHYPKKFEVAVDSSKVFEDLTKYKFGTFRWEVPIEILNGNDEIKCAWLQGFCDAEATVDIWSKGCPRIKISTSNLKGAYQVMNLLSSLGIHTTLQGPYTGCYRICINRRGSMESYYNLINFNHEKKKQILKQYFKNIKKRAERLPSFPN